MNALSDLLKDSLVYVEWVAANHNDPVVRKSAQNQLLEMKKAIEDV